MKYLLPVYLEQNQYLKESGGDYFRTPLIAEYSEIFTTTTLDTIIVDMNDFNEVYEDNRDFYGVDFDKLSPTDKAEVIQEYLNCDDHICMTFDSLEEIKMFKQEQEQMRNKIDELIKNGSCVFDCIETDEYENEYKVFMIKE